MKIESKSSIGLVEAFDHDTLAIVVEDSDPTYLRSIALEVLPKVLNELIGAYEKYGESNFEAGLIGQYLALKKKTGQMKLDVIGQTGRLPETGADVEDTINGIIGHSLIAATMVGEEG